MYGSSLTNVTRSPRASSRAPSDAEARPLPIDETTPPVVKTYFVRFELISNSVRARSARRARTSRRREARTIVAASGRRHGREPFALAGAARRSYARAVTLQRAIRVSIVEAVGCAHNVRPTCG